MEGEKDADRLAALKFPATTNAGGAGKWRRDYTQQLTGASVENVVIIPDHDSVGRAHAEDVARQCHAVGLKVKIVELPGQPEKGDVSGWLDAGHTRDELATLVTATTIYQPSATSGPDKTTSPGRSLRLTPASDVTPRPVRWLWDGRLALGTLNLLGGREGIGKSIVECTLAADITRGRLPGVYAGTPASRNGC